MRRLLIGMGFLLFLMCEVDGLADPEQRIEGVTLHVSHLGDNTDGLSWQTAFRSIQSALEAIPDASGGHRILVRPDAYMEAMLFPAYRGAAGAYNQLIGDVDGRFGSGAAGDVIIDSGDPAKGFKSYDWWSAFRANQQGWSEDHRDPTFSAIGWDRWKLRNLYVTGADAGLFWDLTDQVKSFTVVVEDCVGVGRAFGGGVASGLSRREEPIVFRRCHLWALDWWGDTAAAYVRVENESMPDRPDVMFEDCTLVSPQCALKGGNFGFKTFTKVKMKGCRLAALNFSQPQGTPTDGAIQSVEDGKYLSVDLEDSTVLGYKVFGVRVNKESVNQLQYSTRGSVSAYVQFQQDVPAGFHRLQQWPVEIFQMVAPRSHERSGPKPVERELLRRDLCEMTPVIWKDRLCLLESIRPGGGGERKEYYLLLRDADTGEEIARFAEGHGLASAIAADGVFYAFASRWKNNTWSDVTLFSSRDLENWEKRIVIEGDNEQIFNSSVCESPDGFVMAYESNDSAYPGFTIKFARSKDLENWTKAPDCIFGANRYTACPTIRYSDGFFYVLYLERRSPRHFFETYITRSEDLRRWFLSSSNPVLRPVGVDEGINASDPDIIELDGETQVYYSVGDQRTWMNVKRAVYSGSLETFFEDWYLNPGIEDCGTHDYPWNQAD